MTNKYRISNLLYIIIVFSSDLFIMYFSLNMALYLRTNYLLEFLPIHTDFNLQKYYWIMIITSLIFFFEKIYFIRYDFWGDTKKIFKGLIVSFVAVFTMITLTKISDDYSRAFLTLFFILLFLFIPFFKRLTKKILFKFDFFKQKIKILGNSSLVDKMIIETNENWYFGYKNVDENYEVVLIISKRLSVDELQNMIEKYSRYTRNIYVVPYMYHLDFTHTNIINYFNIRLSAIHIENRLLNSKNLFIKYIFEKFLVILILPFALILHILLIILIKLDSKGAVIFKQKRFGKNGKLFSCYKYRTMYINGNEILEEYLRKNPMEVEYYQTYHKYKNDPRITKIGNFLRVTSLDEFPQFLNILRGDMNLIGPRPYMLSEKEKIGSSNENTILKVKPGITGLWQVSGRNELTFEERIELDKWYIQNWSLWIDFVIFMKTINVVISKLGAK